jgi:gas vesicle protein
MSTKNGNSILAILAGAAIGVGLGILFAPDKGAETRRKISQKGSDSINGIKEKLEELMNIFNEKLNLAELEAKDFGQNMKADGELIKKDIRSVTN